MAFFIFTPSINPLKEGEPMAVTDDILEKSIDPTVHQMLNISATWS